MHNPIPALLRTAFTRDEIAWLIEQASFRKLLAKSRSVEDWPELKELGVRLLKRRG